MSFRRFTPLSKSLVLKNLNGSNGDPSTAIQMLAIVLEHQGRYRPIRMRHGRTNFAGQPSIRISNFSATGFGGSMGTLSFKREALSSRGAAFRSGSG
jgi:hypothetical protein